MNWLDPYTFLLALLGFLSILVAVLLFRPPWKLARLLLAAAAVLSGVFVLLTVLELYAHNPRDMLWLRNFQQISLMFAPVFLFGYALELYEESSGRTVRWMTIAALPTFADVILIFTDGYHGWMRESVTVELVAGYTEISTSSTLLNSLLGTYSYVLLLVAVILLLRSSWDVPERFRITYRLSALIIATPMLIIVTVPLLGWEIPGLFALANAATGLILIALYRRLDFNTVWPVPRQVILENLSEGIMLINEQGDFVEVNESGRRILALGASGDREPETESIHHLFQHQPELLQALTSGRSEAITCQHHGWVFEVQVTVLDRRSQYLRLLVWNNVTEKWAYEQQLEEMARTDPLTKLLNRGAFLEFYEKEREDWDGTFLLLDIDHFKKLNDTYGHVSGDYALKAVASLLKEHFGADREKVVRLGGEEFGILLPAPPKEAAMRAEAFQKALSSMEISSVPQQITVSIGLSRVAPGSRFEAVYQQADEAMYEAKQAGRNALHWAPAAT
ncbi:histidine kinase N-terminal 7TM domain-containing diguanylate cyclase [Alkalicoccus urumqiensis]|uniref:GGDEF domain-containing protein n=1 Tax=Alkalicoccus urumqiensis TaxID=1548213 RepID=A0A2P6MJQ5_ALKUR|nr:diguanylate cyclase [Alkalicoccus urumqiensis]PRO66509.1 hypothetical protein C6I21_03980 [Alkalicoccus urumqiensis]